MLIRAYLFTNFFSVRAGLTHFSPCDFSSLLGTQNLYSKSQMSLRVLNPNAEVLNKSAALHMNINAAKGLQDVLKSNLGPKGTIKMLASYYIIHSFCAVFYKYFAVLTCYYG